MYLLEIESWASFRLLGQESDEWLAKSKGKT